MKETVYIVPHSHWDREWYQPFERHRVRLVELMDRVLTLLEEADYPAYHLDGQMIPIEDYLEIRPEAKERILRLVRQGRLEIGPWYVLQDTFLTSGEAQARNLLYGMRMAREYGACSETGYIADAFGNAGQLPQLMAGAGLKYALFGRGITPGGRTAISDPEHDRPRYSSFTWQSPDGTGLPASIFSTWYSNAMEIPTDPETAEKWLEQKLEDCRTLSSGGNFLFMNGCDHQPVQTDLPAAVKTLKALRPETEFRQTGVDEYMKALEQQGNAFDEVVKGELTDRFGKGDWSLRHTASSRWYLKKQNRKNEILLEKLAEPLSVMASAYGFRPDNGLLRYAWKLLLKNHPHDSICGCSVDEVCREMVTRYDKSIQVGGMICEAASALLNRAAGAGEGELRLTVVNTTERTRSGNVEAVVTLEKCYGLDGCKKYPAAAALPELALFDDRGNACFLTVEDLGERFGYELPDDAFRRPYYARRVRVKFHAEEVPAFGMRSWTLREAAPTAEINGAVTGNGCIENAFLRVTAAVNGTFTLENKKTGRVYRDLGLLEDTGDVGNEYIYRQTADGTVLSENCSAEITMLPGSPLEAAMEITVTLQIPTGAEERLREEQRLCTTPLGRAVNRGREMTAMTVKTRLTLEYGSELLRITVSGTNPAEDHRLRMRFPTDYAVGSHIVDSIYDVMERPDLPEPAWVNPSHCDRMQYFVAAENEREGLALLNRGVYEYEILPERKTLAVTLLRAIGEMGDWGDFPTPEAQCKGSFVQELALLPYDRENMRETAWQEARNYQFDMTVLSGKGFEAKAKRFELPMIKGNGIAVTAFKPAEDGNGFVLRLLNTGSDAAEAEIETAHDEIYYATVTEQPMAKLRPENGKLRLPLRGKEIVTLFWATGGKNG